MEINRKADLRFIPWLNQCNLSFCLEYDSEEFGKINESIQTVRQQTETVDGLLQHTRNKILKILQNKLNKDKEEDATINNYPTIDLKIAILNKNKHINGETVLKCLERFKHLTFTILDKKYAVILNAPLIDLIKIPEIIYSGHAVHPCHFKAILSNHELCMYNWYRSKDKEEWEVVGSQYIYKVLADDVGYYLKFRCIPMNSEQSGDPYETVSENVVATTPEIPTCPFEDRHLETPEFLTGNQFRVVSYNTLSCRYAKNQFEYCPVEYIAIDYRKQLLLKELVGYKADLICLQEVDNRIYSFYFREEFKKLGYGSIYNKKGNRIPEGLAIFYNKNRFTFSGQGQIVFNNEIKTNPSLCNVSKLISNDKLLYETFMKQATSMQFCKVKDKANNEIIILANTHLYYHPDASNIRLLQSIVCLDYLKVIYNKEVKNNKNTKVSVIFCGDFNSQPATDVYKFLTKGMIKYDSGKSCMTTLFHPFQFTSACGTPRYTNYTDDFKACLDYIFYPTNSIDCTKIVPFSAENILSENTALPSKVFPSDHLALVADFQYKPLE